MGRSYWFECSRCGFRATVSGRPDRGFNFHVQTVACRDCKQLLDAVVRLRVPASELVSESSWDLRKRLAAKRASQATPPTFKAALSLLHARGITRFKWQKFKPQCPVSPLHHVELWNDPGPCPRCAQILEKNPLPFRLWD